MSELKYLELHGERVAYQDVRDGDTLPLIHGIAGSSATWRAVIPQLSKRYRVVAPDLLGHGKSAKPRGDYSLGAFAVWLRDLLDELRITRVTVVGHSLGGGELWNAYASLADRQTQQVFLRTLRAVVDYRGQAVSALNRLDELPPDLPTMAIWGDQDRIIPVEHGYAVYAARPGIRLEVLAGIGHFPQVQCPTEVVELIEDFISTTDHRSILDKLQRTRKTDPTHHDPRG